MSDENNTPENHDVNHEFNPEEHKATDLVSGALMTLLSFAAVIAVFMGALPVAGIIVTLLGLTATAMPVPPPPLSQALGAYTAQNLMRFFGVLLIVGGIYVHLFI